MQPGSGDRRVADPLAAASTHRRGLEASIKTRRSKPGRAELVARWTARALTWAIACYLFWFAVNSLIYHSNNYDRDYSSELDQFIIVVGVAALVLAYFFELAAGLACLWLAGVWIYNSVYIIPSFDLLQYLPLFVGALYVTAWLLGRKRENAQPDRDPGRLRAGMLFIFRFLADNVQMPARQEPEEQTTPESQKKN